MHLFHLALITTTIGTLHLTLVLILRLPRLDTCPSRLYQIGDSIIVLFVTYLFIFFMTFDARI